MSRAITDMIETAGNEGRTEGIAERRVAVIELVQKNLGLSIEEACAALGRTVEEYEQAKVLLQAEEI